MDRSYPRQLTGAACENVGNWKRDTRASAARLHTLIYCDLTFTPVTAAVRALVVNEGAIRPAVVARFDAGSGTAMTTAEPAGER